MAIETVPGDIDITNATLNKILALGNTVLSSLALLQTTATSQLVTSNAILAELKLQTAKFTAIGVNTQNIDNDLNPPPPPVVESIIMTPGTPTTQVKP